VLAERVLGDPALGSDPSFATNVARVQNRAATDRRVGSAFASLPLDRLMQQLAAAEIAFARVNGPAELAAHPHLRRIAVDTPTGPAAYPAPAPQWAGEARHYGKVPALGEHTEKVRAEFAPRNHQQA
jgi:itaconate CoA-transferase